MIGIVASTADRYVRHCARTRPSPLWKATARSLMCCVVLLLVGAFGQVPMAVAEPIAVAIADFDNFDTSGENDNRTAQHAARVKAFAGILRDHLAADGRFKVVLLTCPRAPCSPMSVAPADFVQSGRDAGARLMIYGGIHKLSSLVHWVRIHAVDIEGDKLVLDRTFTFRGDTDVAFRRAADFVVQYIKDVPIN
jgi:hypothetical protein